MTKVFISHAGSDTTRAVEAARVLSEAGLTPVVDRQTIAAGDSFLSFMEDSLSNCHYCLLLWSPAASQRDWVKVEWEAALYRSVTEVRPFLVVGRLEDYPLPALLAPRLMVDLFPDAGPGLEQLIAVWRDDLRAEEKSRRPVSYPTVKVEDDPDDEPFYVTSDLFGRTMPLRLSYDVPVIVHLDHIVRMMNLPRRLDHDGRIGINLNYKLSFNNRTLTPDASLRAQSIPPKQVLWLEVEMTPFAASAPVKGGLSSSTFRTLKELSPEAAAAKRRAREQLIAAIEQVGMRS